MPALTVLKRHRLLAAPWPFAVALLAANVASANADAYADAGADARTFTIASDSSCPSADAVREALLSLRPMEQWPPTAVAIQAHDQVLVVDLGTSNAGPRRLAVGPDCPTRAMTVALVLATWMDDLPAEVTAAPRLRLPAAPTPEPPRPSPPVVRYELGAGPLAALRGGIAPGIRMELFRARHDRAIGWQASLVLPATRELVMGGGVTHWTRLAAGVSLVAGHVGKRFFVAGDAGLAGTYTLAWGQGYATNQTDQSFTYGVAAGARAGIPWGRFRLWTDVRAVKWLYGQRVQIDSDVDDSTTVSLPTWDLQWALGVSYVLP